MKIPDTITIEELVELLKKCIEPHHKLAFSLGFLQCMRVSEVTNLKPENIDVKRRIISIKQSKGGKDRNIPISPKIPPRMFNGLPIPCGVRALQIALKKVGKEVLKKDIHFHTLRHSGATYYLNIKKWNLRQVQNFLGHSRVNTTEIYTHVSPDDLQKAMWEGK